MTRTRSAAIAAVFLVVGGFSAAGSGGPASAMPRTDGALGGFATAATGTPIKIDLYEPAIPIPAEPQAELNFSYSHVESTSGPIASARSSAMWPGGPVGEGFKTIGDAVGLPPQLTEGGYPLQTNASSPGEQQAERQEQLPGVVTTAEASPESAVAKAGFNPSGDVSDGSDPDSDPDNDPSGGQATPAPVPSLSPLSGFLQGVLSEPTSTTTSGRTATTANTSEDPANPLGDLAAVADAGTATSVSRTTYAGSTVMATSTSALHDVALLGGIVTIKSITVTARTVGTLDGARSTSSIKYAGLEIGGTPFTITKDGVTAAGRTVPIPGLPDDPADALKALGIGISLPKPAQTNEGVHGAIDVRGIRITLDTGVLKAKLPALPVDSLVGQLPESAKQLKGLLLAISEAHPKVVIYLGSASTDAITVPRVSFGTTNPPTTTTPPGSTTPSTSGGTSSGGTAGTAGTPGTPGTPGTAGGGAPTTPVENLSSSPGLPPLGSVPGMLLLGGLIVGGGAGFWLRRAGLLVLGGASSCSHGLQSGVPDLRKA